MRKIINAVLTCCCCSGIIVSLVSGVNLSPYNISPNALTENDYFKIDNFGMDYFKITESYTQTVCYPTPNDCNGEDGIFSIDNVHNAQTGDFNGDGFEDLVTTVVYFPHTIDRVDTPSKPIFYLNDGKGTLNRSDDLVKDYTNIKRHMLYRTAVADFNSDGLDDYLAGGMGMIKRNPDGTYTNKFEPNLLLLSGKDGKLYDATGNIEGQENGGLPDGFKFAHDLSWGDIDGDSDIDFYAGGILFLNDGVGNFTNVLGQLPKEAKNQGNSPPSANYMMSSLIDDFDNDGIGDLIVFHDDETGSNSYSLISKGKPLLSDRNSQLLPTGLFGTNTKHNFANSADINGDGYKDILIGQTRAIPYYVGRAIQIFVNQGDGSFIDETTMRIDNSKRSDLNIIKPDDGSGEGNLYLLDVDNNGSIDIVDSTGAGFEEDGHSGLHVFLNDGSGYFTVVGKSSYIYLQPFQIEGFEGTEQWFSRPMQRSIPINLDNKHGIDFVSIVQKPHMVWPDTDYQLILYQLTSKKTLSKLSAPFLTMTTSGVNVALSWTPVPGATGYSLVYAPYPYTGLSSVVTIDMGTKTSLSVDLWSGAAFYVAVKAYYNNIESALSNIDYVLLQTNNPQTSYKNFNEIDLTPQILPKLD